MRRRLRAGWRRPAYDEASSPTQGTVMDKHQVKGAAKEVAGKVQKKTGQAIDDRSMQAKGMAKEVAGKAQKTMGDAKEALRDADRRDERLEDEGRDRRIPDE